MAIENSVECDHKNKLLIPSYYDDTEWCPNCGAVRGYNGLMGDRFRWYKWQKPTNDLKSIDLKIVDENV